MKLVNKTGYLKGTKTVNNPVNIIPSNLITTQGMAFPIKANGKTLYPNTGQYKFPTSHVVETPLKQKGTKSAKTFGQAFSEANKAGKESFDWEGKLFSTKKKDDSKNIKPKVDSINNERTFNLSKNFRKRIYSSVNPDQYPLLETLPAIGRLTSGREITDEESSNVTQADKDAWAFYMGVPQGQKSVTRSKYTPTESKTKNTKYYTLRNAYPAFEDSVISNAQKAFTQKDGIFKKFSNKVFGSKDTPTRKTGITSSFSPLENVTYGKGKDEKGDYYSIYDIYNFGIPFEDKIGKPYEVYDRVYYNNKTNKPLYQQKKDGAKVLKYKEGSKGVSLAFSRGEKDPKGGLTQKGVDKYNRATGGNLKMAVTTPPSKLKPGSEPANRRKSFCARMGGMPGPMTKPNGEPSRKALALRKWNC